MTGSPVEQLAKQLLDFMALDAPDRYPWHLAVAHFILQREAALRDKLEIAENGIVSLHDALEENEQLQKVAEAAAPLRDFVNDIYSIYSPIKDSPALRQHLCNVARALNAWEKGRTP